MLHPGPSTIIFYLDYFDNCSLSFLNSASLLNDKSFLSKKSDDLKVKLVMLFFLKSPDGIHSVESNINIHFLSQEFSNLCILFYFLLYNFYNHMTYFIFIFNLLIICILN
jgi:hypothetical protein